MIDHTIEGIVNLLRKSRTPLEYTKEIEQLHSNTESSGLEERTLEKCSKMYVFGDIHAKNEALASAIESIAEDYAKEGLTLDNELDNGRTAFVFVGDLVHTTKNNDNYWQAKSPEERKRIMEENINSVIGVLSLKQRFPGAVFIVQGNHDIGATIPGMVKKSGFDQGEMLYNVLAEYSLNGGLQRLLDNLPIMSIMNIGDKKVILSHALPLPMKGYVNVIKFLDSKRLPFEEKEIPNSLMLDVWGKTREEGFKRIRDRNADIARLLIWSRLEFPQDSIYEYFSPSDVFKHSEEVLKEEAKNFIEDYLYLLSKHLFVSDKTNGVAKISDLLWLVGHESVSGVRDMLKTLGANRIQAEGLKIFQINASSKLPVLSLNVNNWEREDFVSEESLRKF